MIHYTVVLVVLCASVGWASDDTLVPGSFGADVVEATISKIESACIFPDDKLFARRLAYVESYDGTEAKTFRPGYYGGIWQVNQAMFDVTQSNAASSYLSLYIQDISKNFKITWSQVKWQDLTMPLYSTLASRLYVSFQSRSENGGIPRAIDDQSKFWVKYYRPGGDPNDYVTKAGILKNSCISNGGDIIFLFDGSGSIGIDNFIKMKEFAKDVVKSFDVGQGSTQTRFGLIQYSTEVQREFDLKTYSTISAINSAIDKIVYMNGITSTDLGLDEMRMYGFLESNGARPKSENHPRIGIVLTDGVSNNPSATIASADATQKAGINLIGVGIGSNVNMNELNAIASDPDCLNLILLNGFTDIDSLHYTIEKRTCDAPIELPDNGNSSIVLPPGGDQNCKINITMDGITVEVVAMNDATTYFYVSRSSYPSASYHDDKVEASMGHMGLMFIENQLKNGSIDSIFCNIKAGNISSNVSIGYIHGDGDTCKKQQPCLNGGSCENQPGGAYSCSCSPGFLGLNCEHVDNANNGTHNCEDRNPCTPVNIENESFYFPNDDPTKFVQCSNWGQCYILGCPAETKWDQSALTCVHAYKK